MIQLPGYTIRELLHESSATRVFRGTRDADRTPVIVKVLRQEVPSQRKLASFQLGFAIGREIKSDRVIPHLALERFDTSLALVTEDYGATSLDRLRVPNRSTADLLRLAIKIAEALADVHQHHIVHKDIKPHNIVLCPGTGVLKLIDFGISSRLSRENAALIAPERLEGSLAYISPEQTGRMNRSVDSRSDLYSFGVTLYELVTGHLPFAGEDPMELVHCHIARTPQSPRERDSSIPPAVAAIILKLMAKTAEDRYQSAYGVRRDLERCLQALERDGTIRSFPLGEQDVSDRFQLPEKLYGRVQEGKLLVEAFERACAGSSEFLLVSGLSGIGKSVLIQEVHRPITERRGRFCAGKFDQFRRDLPYQALIDALRDLLQQALAGSPEDVARLKAELGEALGENAGLIAQFIPEIHVLLGQLEKVADIDPAEALNRFNRVFTVFLRVFARAERSLTIFLDDLQWADLPSLQLLKVLVIDPTTKNLFMVGAYRSNEVSDSHPLMKAVREIADAGKPVHRIELEPLREEHVAELVGDTLKDTGEEARALAHIVHAKTEGNPFFVGEFLRTLYRDGWISFVGSTGRWNWDNGKISGLGITDNVVQLVASKLQALPEDTMTTLKMAACAGSRFDLRTLALAREASPGEVARQLSRALREGFIEPLDDAYKYMEMETRDASSHGWEASAELSNAWYGFVHDRIHQAAYSFLDEASKKRTHLKIGRLLLDQLSEAEREDQLMSIASHFDTGRDLVRDAAEKRRMLDLHRRAGARARSSMAYGTAAHYLSSALSLLPADAWTTDYALAIAVHTETADAMFLNERYEEMERLATLVMTHAGALLDRVPIYRIRIQAQQSQGHPAEALQLALEVLDALEVRLPRNPTKVHILAEVMRTQLALRKHPTMALAKLPPMTDPTRLAAIDLLRLIASVTYFIKPQLFPILITRMVRLSLAHGNSCFAANGYLLYGMLLCGALEDFRKGHEFGKLGFEVIKVYPSTSLTGKMSMIWGTFVAHWTEPYRDCARFLLDSWRPSLDGGDLEYSAYSVVQSFSMAFLSGLDLEKLLSRYEESTTWLHGSKQLQSRPLLDSWLQSATNLVNAERVVPAATGSIFNLPAELPGLVATGNNIAIAYSCLIDGIMAFLFADHERAAERFALVRRHEDQIFASFMRSALELYEGLNDCVLARGSGRWRASSLLGRAARNLRRLRKWSRHAPKNLQHRANLLAAELERARGHPAAARRFYHAAIEVARANSFLNEEALANERFAGYWKDEQEKLVEETYLLRARQLYERWGANAKVRDLDARHPQVAERAVVEDRGYTGTTTGTSTATTGADLAALELQAVLGASQAIAKEVRLPDLLSRLMTLVMQNAGAERGLLLLRRGDDLLLEAEARIDLAKPLLHESIPLGRGNANAVAPLSVIHFAERMRTMLVLADTTKDTRFSNDPYVVEHHPYSILCLPIINAGKMIGIIYLEHKASPGVFTRDRVEVIDLLSGQIATSIEKAELYHSLEDRIRQRTAELERRNEFIYSFFGRYVDEDVLTSLVETQEGLKSDKRRVTLLMCDLRGFTPMAERLKPEQVVNVINNYLEVMTGVIKKHKGSINEFIGDAILAIFGAPDMRADDAERAVACAIEMQMAMKEVNARNGTQGLPAVEMGIGLNTGEVVVGSIGSDRRAKYAVIGSTVNITARIEACTVGGQILATESTLREAGTHIITQGTMNVEPKGVKAPIAIGDVCGIEGRYRLHLTAAEDVLADAPAGFLVRIRPLDLATKDLRGKVARFSYRGAEVECSEALPPFANVKVWLCPPQGPELDLELYAKVLGRRPRTAGAMVLRFTSVPPEARELMASLLGAPVDQTNRAPCVATPD